MGESGRLTLMELAKIATDNNDDNNLIDNFK